MFNLYNDQISNPDISSWANSIRKTIHDSGFAYLFNNFNDNSYCFPMIKQRLRDQFMQKWRESLNNTSKLFFYCKFKTDFEFDNYLEVVKNITVDSRNYEHLRGQIFSSNYRVFGLTEVRWCEKNFLRKHQ